MQPEDLRRLSEELALSPSGLRKRIHALGLQPGRGSRGRFVVSAELADTLREADRWFKSGAGTDTVRRRLGLCPVVPPSPTPVDFASPTRHGRGTPPAVPEGSVEDLPPGVSQGHRPPACAADAEASDSEGPDGLSDVLALEDGGDKDVLPLLSIAHQEPPFESPYQVRELVSQAVAQAVRLETELAEKYARATHRIGELEERTRTLEAERDRLVSELAQYRIVSRWVRRPWWKFW